MLIGVTIRLLKVLVFFLGSSVEIPEVKGFLMFEYEGIKRTAQFLQHVNTFMQTGLVKLNIAIYTKVQTTLR